MSGRLDFDDMLRQLVQQQSALGQQQAALLQLQTESLHLQRMLIERAIGDPTAELTPRTRAGADDHATPLEPESEPREIANATLVASAQPDPSAPAPLEADDPAPLAVDPAIGESPQPHPVIDNHASLAAPANPVGVPLSRAARYMQPPVAKPARTVTRHDVDLLTRLYETGDAAHLVLQFGEYKGVPLLHVAQTDPEYVRQLALTAQRPQVRAAARQVVVALEAVAAHKPRTARTATRRSRAAG